MFRTRLLTVAVVALLPLTITAEAHARTWNITAPVNGTATVAKLGKTLAIPAGSTFSGPLSEEDIINGYIPGNLDIKPITTQITVVIPTFGTVNATVKIISTRTAYIGKGPDFTIIGNAYFKIAIPRISPVLAPSVNLVQPGCSTPEITAPLVADQPTETIHVTSTFTIPAFKGCSLLFGIRDAVVTSLVSGPGNGLDVNIGPIAYEEIP